MHVRCRWPPIKGAAWRLLSEAGLLWAQEDAEASPVELEEAVAMDEDELSEEDEDEDEEHDDVSDGDEMMVVWRRSMMVGCPGNGHVLVGWNVAGTEG